MDVLHIVPHLGGGVGKTIYGLVKQSLMSKSDFNHIIVSLEETEKKQFVDKINECGNKHVVCPTLDELEKLMEEVSIVQVEYWNHPLLIKYLCSMITSPIRLLCWSHNNGLFNPVIPKKLMLDSHKFVFTSLCSLENKDIRNMVHEHRTKFGLVYSSGGFDKQNPENYEKLSVGYFGSTTFSKMHPNYADYINKIKIPNFKVKIIGDLHNKDILEKQSNRFEFKGFVSDTVKELKSVNVLAYILNPEHYGTTENSLLEAMSLGIIPIVLDNSAERCIVNDGLNGFIIHSQIEFEEVINYLYKNPNELKKLGTNAILSVRDKFSIESTYSGLNNYYKQLMKMKKRKITFKSIFGNTPDQWFLSCQGNKEIFKKNGTVDLSIVSNYSKHMLFEKAKGSVFHFSKYFPNNKMLKDWSKSLKS